MHVPAMALRCCSVDMKSVSSCGVGRCAYVTRVMRKYHNLEVEVGSGL